jgi:membrane-bound serine protease (ClpP class)
MMSAKAAIASRQNFFKRWMLQLVFAAVALFAAPAGATPSPENGIVVVAEVKGAIGVSTVRLVSDAIADARRRDARGLVVRLDTPGGLVSATRDIIQHMLASPVPVIIYVAPGGARAASAGTFLVYAAHLAAMAPGTNIGAATPVQLGGIPGIPSPAGPKDEDKDAPAGGTAAERKALNDTIAMLRSLAQLRGRNIEWAEKAVKDAATLTATDALKEGVIEVVARDVNELLDAIDGRKVVVANVERTLETRGAATAAFEPNWRIRLLGVISDPNVAFILLLVGFYGIVLEFFNPGGLVAGVVGAISLLLALTALSALPVQYAALGLIVLGMALIVAEAFAPGFGVLGIGGVIAFIAGSLFLFDPSGSDIDLSVSLPLILAAAAISVALALFVLGAALRAQRRPTATGAEEMIGSVAEVVDWTGQKGRVRIHGEIWFARADRAFAPQDAVRVVRREGLTLVVGSP